MRQNSIYHFPLVLLLLLSYLIAWISWIFFYQFFFVSSSQQKTGQIPIILSYHSPNSVEIILLLVKSNELNWIEIVYLYTYLDGIKCSSNVHTAGIHSLKDVGWHTWIAYNNNERSDEYEMNTHTQTKRKTDEENNKFSRKIKAFLWSVIKN